MKLLKRLKDYMVNEAAEYSKLIDSIKEPQSTIEENGTTTPEDEWIWVEGYKGTDKDMTCRDFQYGLGIQFDIPSGEEVVECENGLHLCLNLNDVFNYYDVCNGNRFFKVKALVRKRDVNLYGTRRHLKDYRGYTYSSYTIDKLVAKSIILISELTTEEILNEKGVLKDIPVEYRNEAIELSPKEAIIHYHTDILIKDGYSRAFADYIIRDRKFDIAHAVGSQEGLSMDMKVLYILHRG